LDDRDGKLSSHEMKTLRLMEPRTSCVCVEVLLSPAKNIFTMERIPAYQPLCREEEEELLSELEEKDGVAWNSNSTEIIPTNTRSFVVYLSIMLLSLSANILLVMQNAKMRIAHTPAKSNFSKPHNLLNMLLAHICCRRVGF
jgi:hypothetical protein